MCANVMVRKDGKLGFMLVYFDESGIIDKARYRINVNKADIWQPDDMSDDDLAVLNQIVVYFWLFQDLSCLA